jgi:class 3 adenylate cyclase
MYKKDLVQSKLKRIYQKGIKPEQIKAIYRFIMQSKPKDLLLLNPNIMSIKLDLEQGDLLDIIILGVVEGLFEMQWDMSCPHCGEIADHSHHFNELPGESHCTSCKVNFDNFADENITIAISLHPNLFEGEAPMPGTARKIDKRVQPVTALDLIGSPFFRKYFSSEVPDVTHSVKIRSVTVLFTDLVRSTELYSSMGDLNAYSFIKEHFDALFQSIAKNSGGVIKTIGDAIMVIFKEPVDAVKTSFELKQAVADLLVKNKIKNDNYGLKVGISSGTALIVKMNDVMDLFGTTINIAARIVNFADNNSVSTTPSITDNPEVKEFLATENIGMKPVQEKLKGIPGLSDIHLLVKKGKWYSKILG